MAWGGLEVALVRFCPKQEPLTYCKYLGRGGLSLGCLLGTSGSRGLGDSDREMLVPPPRSPISTAWVGILHLCNCNAHTLLLTHLMLSVQTSFTLGLLVPTDANQAVQ